MRKTLAIIGLALLFAAGASAGYLYAISQRGSSTAENAHGPDVDGKGPSDGLYKDDEVAGMRQKLAALPLPISQDNAFLLLGIARPRIDKNVNFGGGGSDKNSSSGWIWRLSPTFCIAMYSEYGANFGPKPPNDKSITRVAIGKAIPDPGNPKFQVALDDKDNEKTEISLPKTGKASEWTDWKYPNLTKTVSSWHDSNDIAGGYVGLTSDDFDKVASFYYKRCDVPNGTMTLAKSPYTSREGNKLEYLMFRGFNNAVQAGLPAARVCFLNVKTPTYTVGVTLVQPQGQKETQIFVNQW